ncbi:MAG: hypothetical protein ACFE9L_05285 [Candidatus Hodarchaeota archaeon]
MPYLIPIKYHKKEYPLFVKPQIEEIAAHFDKKDVTPTMHYSLHTEYSYGKRDLENELINEYPTLKHSQKKNIPELWKNEKWAKEFFQFIASLINDHIDPELIEIHPPFSEYCSSIKDFLSIYSKFEQIFHRSYPKSHIVIENRYGSRYPQKGFLISNSENLITLSQEINRKNLKLKIALDIPQLLSSYGLTPETITRKSITRALDPIKRISKNILGIHLWGKKRSAKRLLSHIGDLNSFCNNNNTLKQYLLGRIANLFDDDIPRYFVPEVNSKNEDLVSIVNDLRSIGFHFV